MQFDLIQFNHAS